MHLRLRAQKPFREKLPLMKQIRVCEMCIKNDANVGRILHCGICGIVACDEDCGPVMYECTGEFTTRSVSRGLGLGEVAPSFSEGPSGREGGGYVPLVRAGP